VTAASLFCALLVIGILFRRLRARGSGGQILASNLILVGVIGAFVFSAVALGGYVWRQLGAPTLAAAPAGAVGTAPLPNSLSTVDFVKNQGVGREYTGNPGEQPTIVYRATYSQTGTRLRAFVEYQAIGMPPNTVNRVALGETKDFVKNEQWMLPIISREKGPDGHFVFWWGTKKDRGQRFFSNLQARIVIVGDDGREQHYYFLITDGVINDFVYPDVIEAQSLDFASKWEASDAR
jgi:hypothetical protein